MIKIITIVNILLFFSITIYSQSPTIQWQKSFGGSLEETSRFIETTSDGGYIVAGSSMSNDGDVTGHYGTSTTTDWWVVKFDNAGVIQWQKSYGGSGNDGLYCVKQTADGGYILGGDSFSNDGDVSGHHGALSTVDVWVVKLNGAGSILWQKSFGGIMNEGARSIKETSDGNFIFVGISYSNDGDVSGHAGAVTPFNGDIWVAKISNTGIIIWQDSFGGTSLDYGTDIVESSDGGFAVVGTSYSNDGETSIGYHGNADGVLFKLNATGIFQWGYSLGGSVPDNFESIKQTADSGFVLVGYSGSSDGNLMGITGSGQIDSWLLKADSVGSIQWTKLFGGSVFDHGSSVEIDLDGGYIIGSTSFSDDFDVSGHHGTTTTKDFWITKTDYIERLIENFKDKEALREQIRLVIYQLRDQPELLGEEFKIIKTILSLLVSEILLNNSKTTLHIYKNKNKFDLVFEGSRMSNYTKEDINYLKSRTRISINLNELIAEYLTNDKFESINKEFGLISAEELQILDAVRKKEVSEIVIKKDQNEDLTFTTTVRSKLTDEKVQTLKRILRMNEFDDVRVVLRNDKDIYLENKTKKKL